MVDPSDTETRARPGPLFSMDAADNAEVVQPHAPRGPESMWTTRSDASPTSAANGAARHVPPMGEAQEAPAADPWADLRAHERAAAPGAGATTSDTATSPTDHATSPFAPPGPRPDDSAGGVFSADPIVYDDDVVDSEIVEPVDDASSAAQVPHDRGQRPPLFSSGSDEAHGSVADDTAGIWRLIDEDDAAGSAQPPPTPGATAPGPSAHASTHDAHHVGTSADGQPGHHAHHMGPGHGPLDEDDPNGFERAVLRLGDAERERAAVPLCVCGALLGEDEWVVGALTGQMLGQPAAVVVTGTRVLVANGRRWQPIVDEYRINAQLSVRGRHDGRIAALSFTDDERLSMVDGIEQVSLAMQLAAAVRDPQGGGREH